MGKHQYTSGIIGNCGFIAHINLQTNVSWMCWPKFDSSFVFGALLDNENGGEFSILPKEEFSSNQYYSENTNILCTEISSPEGKYRITDYAPRYKENGRYFRPLMLIRKIEPLVSTPEIKICCRPVDNYGQTQLQVFTGSNHLEYHGTENPLRLTSNISVNYIKDSSFFVLDEVKYLVLCYGLALQGPRMPAHCS